ncbi:unknown [Succinatimonas sp. CAG:777]|nr:unknown [Succinatimonas sp. CAG:777]
MIADVSYRQYVQKKSTDLKKQLISDLKPFKNNSFVIWGNGGLGRSILGVLSEMGFKNNVKAFCNSTIGEDEVLYVDGIQVLPCKKAVYTYQDSFFIIATSYKKEVIEYMSENFKDISLKFFCL